MPEIFNASSDSSESPLSRQPADYSEVMRNHKRSRHNSGSFVVRPQKIHMDIQQSDEKILLLLRRHFITNIGWMVLVFIMIIAPFIGNLIFDFNFIPDRFITATIILWYLLTLSIAIQGFLIWYYNVFIITDERVIDVDFLNLIYKNVSAAKIDNIEDVTFNMGGAVRNVLNFGTVLIQTAAEKTQFEFEDVPKPQEVAKFLNELILEEEREQIEGRVS